MNDLYTALQAIKNDILSFLKENPDKEFSSFQIHAALKDKGWLIENIIDTMGHLADNKLVRFQNQRYVYNKLG